MRKLLTIGLLIFSFNFFGCGTSKIKAQHEPPFKVMEAFYDITEEAGNSFITVRIITNNSEIKLDTVYFRNTIIKLTKEEKIEKVIFTGKEMLDSTSDLILHKDPIIEFGNKPPTTFPFQLKENEAMLIYYFNGKKKQLKISELKELKAI